MKLITRPRTAVAAALIVMVAAATMASGHVNTPTTSLTLTSRNQTNTKAIITATGTYNPDDTECQKEGRPVTVLYKLGGVTVAKVTTTGTGGSYTTTASLQKGFTYTVEVTVKGEMLGDYGVTHACTDGTASGTITI